MRRYNEAVKAEVKKRDESAWASGHGPELPAAGYPWGHPLQLAKSLAAAEGGDAGS